MWIFIALMACGGGQDPGFNVHLESGMSLQGWEVGTGDNENEVVDIYIDGKVGDVGLIGRRTSKVGESTWLEKCSVTEDPSLDEQRALMSWNSSEKQKIRLPPVRTRIQCDIPDTGSSSRAQMTDIWIREL
jgi:hypothetical protein